MQATRTVTGIDPDALSPDAQWTLRQIAVLLASGYKTQEIAKYHGLRPRDVERRLDELRAELSGDA